MHSERQKQQGRLDQLRSEIAKYELELSHHEKLESRSRKNVASFQKKTLELRSKIAALQSEAADLESERTNVVKHLKVTHSSLDLLRQEYANSTRYFYEHRSEPRSLFLSPTNDNGAALRMDYYAHILRKAHGETRTKLDSTAHSLGVNEAELSQTLQENKSLMSSQATEAQRIELARQQEEQRLKQIQLSKDQLKKLIAERRRSAARIESLIATLVVKEEKSRSRKGRTNSHSNRNSDHTTFRDDISSGRAYGPHTLFWPNTSHRLREGFGEHRNSELNTVTVNLGIDIAATSGSSVTAAAEGEVSIVSSLPSYGRILVLRHSGGLHTVYANLSGVRVGVGEHVHAGQSIGSAGENAQGEPTVHFEVWKGKQKQNPIGWLR